jgi:septum formation protein
MFHPFSTGPVTDLSLASVKSQPQTCAMIILASTSVTRRRILEAAGVPVLPVASGVDEDQIKHTNRDLAPRALAAALAVAKAEAVQPTFPNDLIIGCDQLLACDGQLFDKPQSQQDAFNQLSVLQGKTHTLHTALCCLEPGQSQVNIISEPNLLMRRLTPPEIQHYLTAAGEDILSSVGCYQIEGKGIQLFEAIDGDHFSIQGLPLLPLLHHLRRRKYLQP